MCWGGKWIHLKTIKCRWVCCAESDLQQGTVLSEICKLHWKAKKSISACTACQKHLSPCIFYEETLLLITIFTHSHRSQSECFCRVGLAWWPSLTRPDGWFYLTFAKSNHRAKLQGGWQLCFLPRRRLKGSGVAFQTFETQLYVHQQSVSRWLMAIKSQRTVYVTLVSLGGLFRWIYTICFLRGDAVLQRYSDLWHLP